MKKSVKLDWHRFEKLTEARSQFAMTPCVYIQTDARGRPIRVGKASKGLETRYRGGTGRYSMQPCTTPATWSSSSAAVGGHLLLVRRE